MKTVENLLKIARGELGYHEKNSPEHLDEKTAPNDGSRNFTKYARDLAEAGYYQAGKQGYEWCDVFVDWCFFRLCGSREAAEAMTCQTGPYGAGCEWSARYYAGKGRLDGTPRVGDQAFFGDRDHTGIVSAVDGSAVTVIEGNKNHRVEENTYHIGDGWLSGEFGHPFYEEAVKPAPQTESKPNPGHREIAVGDMVSILPGAKWYGGEEIPAWVLGKQWKVAAADGERIVINESADGKNAIMSPICEKYLTLKAETQPIQVGDRVRLHADATVYGSSARYSDWVYRSDLYLRELSGDRAVISTQREGAVTGPVDKKYLERVGA